MSNNEKAFYQILKRRAVVPGCSYAEYMAAAKEVVAQIPPEKITPIEEMITWIELTILDNRSLRN